jgi:hypothetical protein
VIEPTFSSAQDARRAVTARLGALAGTVNEGETD